MRVDFGYDWQGSRVTKRVWNNSSGTGPLAADLRFVYDGWNLIAELNATNNAVVGGYVWGYFSFLLSAFCFAFCLSTPSALRRPGAAGTKPKAPNGCDTYLDGMGIGG